MGDDNKEEQGKVTPARQSVFDFAEGQRNTLASNQTANEKEFIPISQNFYNAYNSAQNRNFSDYNNLMTGYNQWQGSTAQPLVNSINSRTSPTFTFQNVTAPRTSGESLAGYRDFAQTGGYSEGDIRDLRARGTSPIRAAYGNTMRELDRAKAVGGDGGAANYIAARSRAQRELPQQLADATQGVNASLAEAIRSGKLAGLSGMTGITEAEAGRSLQAALANQSADLQAQNLTEQGRSSKEARQIAAAQLSLQGMDSARSLYGTTPGLSSTFGSQALQAYNQRNQQEQLRNQYGLGLIDAQLQSLGQQAQPGTPWWQQALGLGTNIASTMIGMPGGAI